MSSLSLSLSLKVQFPHPFSRLLDIRVIIGDNSRLDKLVAEMEKEIATEVWSSWKKLRWFQEEWYEDRSCGCVLLLVSFSVWHLLLKQQV